MKQRINVLEKAMPALKKALSGLGVYLSKSPVEQPLLELVYYRVSQINGCAYCLDMHSKDLLAKGETKERLFVLNAWREASFYTERERAALAWAEALTTVAEGHVPDETYEEAQKQFSEEELIDLTIAVMGINSYNRFNIAFPNPDLVGTYQPGKHAVNIN